MFCSLKELEQYALCFEFDSPFCAYIRLFFVLQDSSAAERLHREALAIREARLGKNHPEVAQTWCVVLLMVSCD